MSIKIDGYVNTVKGSVKSVFARVEDIIGMVDEGNIKISCDFSINTESDGSRIYSQE